MTNPPNDKAADAGAIRAALDAGDTHQAYRLFRPHWAAGLDTIPEHLRSALIRHVLTGQPTGSFLSALLENDLMEAVGLADPTSLANLRPLCIFLYCYTPPLCRGDAAKVKAWREEGGALCFYYDNADLEGAA